MILNVLCENIQHYPYLFMGVNGSAIRLGMPIEMYGVN